MMIEYLMRGKTKATIQWYRWCDETQYVKYKIVDRTRVLSGHLFG